MNDTFSKQTYDWEAGLKSIYSTPTIPLPTTKMTEESDFLTKKLKADFHEAHIRHLKKIGIKKSLTFEESLHIVRVNIAYLVTLGYAHVIDGETKNGIPMQYAKITKEGIEFVKSEKHQKISQWALWISFLATISTIVSATVTFLNYYGTIQ
jgi:hypothetical protein